MNGGYLCLQVTGIVCRALTDYLPIAPWFHLSSSRLKDSKIETGETVNFARQSQGK
jgi:hypothetical protein